jgi:hypothetical protein
MRGMGCADLRGRLRSSRRNCGWTIKGIRLYRKKNRRYRGSASVFVYPFSIRNGNRRGNCFNLFFKRRKAGR